MLTLTGKYTITHRVARVCEVELCIPGLTPHEYRMWMQEYVVRIRGTQDLSLVFYHQSQAEDVANKAIAALHDGTAFVYTREEEFAHAYPQIENVELQTSKACSWVSFNDVTIRFNDADAALGCLLAVRAAMNGGTVTYRRDDHAL